jgi:hypothetical protein
LRDSARVNGRVIRVFEHPARVFEGPERVLEYSERVVKVLFALVEGSGRV